MAGRFFSTFPKACSDQFTPEQKVKVAKIALGQMDFANIFTGVVTKDDDQSGFKKVI